MPQASEVDAYLEELSEDKGCSSSRLMTSLVAKVELEDDEHCWSDSRSEYSGRG